jgi:Uma2 family endonuclease
VTSETSIKDGYCVEPIVIIEVLSPSTKRLDRVEKRRFYQKIASLRYYAIVHQDRMRLELLTRADGWTERVFERPDDVIPFDALGVAALLRDIYRRTGVGS